MNADATPTVPGQANRIVHNSGREEWVTPPEIIAAVKAVMGAIDLDPASSAAANAVVGAGRYYDVDDDGLFRPWRGRVWLNPPFRHPVIGQFVNRLLVTRGDWDQAMCITNSATETRWGQALLREADGVCFPSRRLAFWRDGEPAGSPLQGQMICYFAPRTGVRRDHLTFFWNAFDEIGAVR